MSQEGLQLLSRVKAFSPYLTQVMRRHPALVQDLFDQDGYREKRSPAQLAQKLKERLAGVRDFQVFCLLLRHFKQEEILRIAIRDLGGLAGLKETTAELSALAQVCLANSVSFCSRDQAGFKSGPLFSRSIEEGLVILGLGKLGGEELNFSSDIDLIVLFHPAAAWPVSALEQKEVAQILTKRLIQAMGAQIEGDHVFRVDLGLRPGGKDSELVISLESALDYYQNEARTWERLALIKARPLAGNPALGNLFLKEVQPIIYRKFVDYTVLADIRSMKQKILAETQSHLLRGDDIKLGPGGIREIEFIIQSLQMIFGGRLPALREKNSLKALIKLQKAQILPKEEFQQLRKAYIFLRTLEHRLQMVHQQQTHSLPRDPQELERIAKETPLKGQRGLLTAKEITGELDRVRKKVRIAFDNLLLAQNSVSLEKVAALVDSPLEPEDLERELKVLGFQKAGPIQEIIHSWRGRLASSSAREKVFLTKLFPLLLGFSLQTVNPDQSLLLADRFLRSVGGRTGILAMLLERTALTKEIMDLFARSAMLGRLFVQNPDMMDHLVLKRTLTGPALEERPASSVKIREQGKDLEDRLSWLRRWKSEQFLEIALEEISGRISASEASERLSTLADRVLSETTRMAEETLNQEVVHPIYPDHSSSPPPSPFCVLGLGKLGGRELGYASDLDLIFVYSLKTPFLSESGKPPSPGRGRDGKKWITYHEYLVKLAQRLISYLSLPLKEGAGYAIDTRLRPSGSFGPLIVSLDAFREYYRGQARNWEKQALLKARIMVGSPKLSRQVQETVARILYETPPPSQVREEMAHVRSRMEKERSGEGSGRFNPKLGFGGLTDIEFLVQFLQWTHGPAFPDLRQTNTLQALKSLSNNGLLSDETHLQLQEAYQFLTTLDHGLQLLFDRKGDARTYDPEELKQLVDLNVMGLGNPTLLSWDMVSHYEKVRRNVRSIFKTVFSGQVQAV